MENGYHGPQHSPALQKQLEMIDGWPKTCPKCGHTRQEGESPHVPAEICPNCGVVYRKASPVLMQHFDGPVSQPASGRRKREQPGFTLLNLGLAVVGAALMALGAFLPVFSWGAMSVTYFKGGDGDGLFVVIAAAVVLLGAMLKSRRLVGYPAVAGFGLMLWGMFTLSSTLGDAKEQMARDLAGNPFAGLATSISESASMEWGWAVMILGAVLAMAAAVIDERKLRESYASN